MSRTRFDIMTEYVKPLSKLRRIVRTDKIFEGKTHLLSPATATIQMDGDFSHDVFLDLFMENLRKRNIGLKVKTWQALCNWADRRFKPSKDRRIFMGMEMLFVFSQGNLDELFQSVKHQEESDESEEEDEESEERLSLAELCFDKLMYNLAKSLYLASPVLHLRHNVVADLKEFLLKPSIKTALAKCLAEVFFDSSESISVTVDGVSNLIRDMNIHIASPFVMFKGLVLRDGIILFNAMCASGSVGDDVPDIYAARASIYTLTGHETIHYLVRAYLNDYAFSTPTKYLSDGKNPGARFDNIIPQKLLELGRKFELELFGNIQPDWDKSKQIAAEKFLDRALSSELYPCPLIASTEHDLLGLKPRACPSVSMAAELDLEYLRDPFGYSKWD